MSSKVRLTVTVDPELLQAGNEAVAAGRAESLSAWVNQALAGRVASERRLQALGEAIAQYEAEHGEITAKEMASQSRRDRESARIVRGKVHRSASRPRRRRVA